jgi:hypothetical protein
MVSSTGSRGSYRHGQEEESEEGEEKKTDKQQNQAHKQIQIREMENGKSRERVL